MTDPRSLLADGDIAGLMRHLRFNAEHMEQVEVAELMAGAAAALDFDDLHAAAVALSGNDAPQELFAYAYACVDRGVPFLAIPALRRALDQLPGEPTLILELASALETENRHTEAVGALEPHVESLDPWPARYLLAYNALFAGDVERADREAARLPEPDASWRPAQLRIARMISRARAAQEVSPLDGRNLRGWHFALTGGLLTTISPHGYDEGMNGRYAYTSDSYASCRKSLDRLQTVLRTTHGRPGAVALLDDRDSRILGLAAAQLLGLPAHPYAGPEAGTVVVAYDLNGVTAEGLWERAEGQVLFEHASCWTTPPAVSADVSGFLHQVVTPPWGEQMRASPDRQGVETVPRDQRSEEQLAAEIVGATADMEDDFPPDEESELVLFASGVWDEWLIGPRLPVHNPGPVPSNRFL